jgi:CheY-like chemotaxis protein
MTLDIILVEDNAMNFELARDLLEARGHRVRLAENGARFRDYLRGDAPPDLILMDILLPDTDGVTLLGELRSSSFRGVPVIALTAQASPQDLARFRSAGFDAIITKPIDTRAFESDILRTVEISRTKRGASS